MEFLFHFIFIFSLILSLYFCLSHLSHSRPHHRRLSHESQHPGDSDESADYTEYVFNVFFSPNIALKKKEEETNPAHVSPLFHFFLISVWLALYLLFFDCFVLLAVSVFGAWAGLQCLQKETIIKVERQNGGEIESDGKQRTGRKQIQKPKKRE